MAGRRPRLVFLGGVASGGTDLLRNVVNAHAEIDMPLEFAFLAQAAAKFGSSVDPSRAQDLVLELARVDAYHNFKRVAAPLPPRSEYEDLLADLEGSCRRICDFLELGFDDRMLHFDRYVEEQIAGKYNFGSPIVASNREKWRAELDAATVRRIEEIAFEGMQLLGYRAELACGARPLSRVEAIRGTARDAWATVAVGNRAETERKYLKRGLQVAFEVRKSSRCAPPAAESPRRSSGGSSAGWAATHTPSSP